jgi:hypothetical protein
VVDGGTGFVSGCWRPILIPDTFFDKDNRVWAICDPEKSSQLPGGSNPCRPAKDIDPKTTPAIYAQLQTTPELALQDQDHYVSRFASLNPGSQRGSNPDLHFMQERYAYENPLGSPRFDIVPNKDAHVQATSLRDAWNETELKSYGGRNLIGIQMYLRQRDWRLIDFAKSGISGNFPTDPAQQINKGCCAPIQVGQHIYVYPDPLNQDKGIYQNFAQALKAYFDTTVAIGGVTTNSASQV